MSIIIDTNSLHSVFDDECSDYDEYRYVFDWVKNEKLAAFIYGGTKYKGELRKAIKYLKIISEFKNVGKAIEVNDKLVDDYETYLNTLCSIKAFNDKHIVALVAISGCRLICSKDAASYPFLKNHIYYPAGVKIPKIYSGKKTKNILKKRNIAKIQNAV